MLVLFHLAAFSINAFTLWYDQNYVNFPFKKEILQQNFPFKGRILMLTLWGLTIQTIYFGVAFLNDIIGSNERLPKKSPIIRIIKDTLFSLAFPLALYVAIAFWGIYFIDKELILPDVVAKELPPWTNHVMHTTVLLFIVIELLFSTRTYPLRSVFVSTVTIFVLSYLSYLYFAFLKTGTWVYPILDVLPWHLRIVFFTVSTLFVVGLGILGDKLDAIVNPRRDGVKQKRR